MEASRDGDTDDSGPRRGPFLCFARRHCLDVLVNEDKIAGSAQRGTKQAVLQHGSIILGNRYTQHPAATVPAPFDEGVGRVRSGVLQQLTNMIGAPFDIGQWSERELSHVETLVAKYAGHEWTKRM